MERAECIDELDFVMDTGDRILFSKRNKTKIKALFDEYTFQREKEAEMK